MPNVLIVDDESDLAQLLDFNLKQSGFHTRIAPSGADALRLARQLPPDLILLDRMLPDMSGVEVCRQLRQDPTMQSVLIVMLTAKGEESDRIRGFEAGADDYVSKPFSVRELVLRLHAIFRRSGVGGSRLPINVGALTLDPSTHRFFVNKEEVTLTALEFKLLHRLMSQVGMVQPREQLLEEVWGLSSRLETRTIDTHVMRLREKLGPAREYVETVRGVGYRMVERDTE